MAAFQDYLDLRLAVADHVGNRTISDVMPRLVAMAEADLNQKLRCRQQVATETLIFNEGEAQLPADYLEMIALYDPNGCPIRQGNFVEAKRGCSYAVDGNYAYLGNYTGERDATYYARIKPLKCAPAHSNWLLNDYPEVYLYAVSIQAAKYLRDMEVALATAPLLENALKSLKISDDRARWAQSTVRVGGLTP